MTEEAETVPGEARLSAQTVQRARQYHERLENQRRLEREQLRLERYQRVRAAIQRLAPAYPHLRAVYLFGSLVQPGRHSLASDVDVAVECDDLAAASEFWRALETELDADVDLRPCKGVVAWAVRTYGEPVYEREILPAGA
jgi:predicted nucleotidyltransferase